MLVERSAQPAPAEGLKAWRDVAQHQIEEEVIDACLFARPASYAANAMASHSGLLVGMLLRKSREIRAGGLPQHFVLAVTDDEVIALRRTMKARGGPMGQPGEEVARWPRDDVRVDWSDGGYLFKVTLCSSSGVQKVECTVAKSPLTESFLELLGDPQRDYAAA
jgi:hypothetical protein